MTVEMLAAAGTAAAERPRREFLTFRLGDESYGVDILKVQEIRDIDAVTRVPHVPPYLRGVINLRDVLYFLSLMLAALAATAILVDLKKAD